jgi:hypothetical protein
MSASANKENTLQELKSSSIGGRTAVNSTSCAQNPALLKTTNLLR